MDCTSGLTRTLLFLTNFAFLLVGIGLLAVGVIYKISLTSAIDAIPDKYSAINYVPIMSIVVGTIIFFIAFLGCCGALKRSISMLSWYGGILILIFIAQIGIGIFGLHEVRNSDDFKQTVGYQITSMFQSGLTEAVNIIQHSFKCCGVEGPPFWNDQIPKSCHVNGNVNESVYTVGCRTEVPEKLLEHIRTIAIGAIIVSAVEIVAAILALCLTSCIRKDEIERY